MKNYITIDGGTTNTRVHFVSGGAVRKSIKIPMGIKGDQNVLWRSIRDTIGEILSSFNLKKEEITAILLSGMITREYEHICAPVGICDLHETMHKESIMDIPAYFIRGVKTQTDLMRGEETELYGLCGLGAGIYVLPGSHTKIIVVDENCKITDIKTMLTGEMLEVLSKNTILFESVDIRTNMIDRESLISGYRCCRDFGINYALFQVRVLSQAGELDTIAAYSFYTGAIMCGDVQVAEKMRPEKITIAGKAELCEPMAILLGYAIGCEVCEMSDVTTLSAKGALKIFEQNERPNE